MDFLLFMKLCSGYHYIKRMLISCQTHAMVIHDYLLISKYNIVYLLQSIISEFYLSILIMQEK